MTINRLRSTFILSPQLFFFLEREAFGLFSGKAPITIDGGIHPPCPDVLFNSFSGASSPKLLTSYLLCLV